MTAQRTLPANRRIRPSQPGGSEIGPSGSEPTAKKPAGDTRKGAAGEKAGRGAAARVGRALAGVRERLAGLRAAAGVVFVVAASIALAWGIRQHVVKSPRFAVKTIRVDGTSRRTPEQVAETAGLAIGMNIFGLDLENARRRVLQDPWIAEAKVDRRLPSSVSIEVTEREAAAVVAVDADLYLCTFEGEVFKRLEPEDPKGLVVITGMTAAQLASHRAVAVRQLRTALELLASYQQRGPAKLHPAHEIHVAQDGTFRMTVGASAVTLEMGRAPFAKKVQRAARVLGEVRRRNAEPEVVFLDNEAHPERVVVRMR